MPGRRVAARAPDAVGARVEWATAAGTRSGVTNGLDNEGALLIRIGDQTERIMSGNGPCGAGWGGTRAFSVTLQRKIAAAEGLGWAASAPRAILRPQRRPACIGLAREGGDAVRGLQATGAAVSHPADHSG